MNTRLTKLIGGARPFLRPVADFRPEASGRSKTSRLKSDGDPDQFEKESMPLVLSETLGQRRTKKAFRKVYRKPCGGRSWWGSKWNGVLAFVILCGLLTPWLAGCQRGIHFPRLYPATVRVTDGGKPVANVIVTLCPQRSIGNFHVRSVTDENGIGEIVTFAATKMKRGAPVCDYHVTVHLLQQWSLSPKETADFEIRTAGLNPDQLFEEIERVQNEKYRKNEAQAAFIPQTIRGENYTPISFSIRDGQNELTIELSQYHD